MGDTIQTADKKMNNPFQKKKGAREAYKTSINFVGINETHENWALAVPFSILIIIVAIIISKFAVVDRYARLWEKQAEAERLESELEEGTLRLSESSELTEQFYHYTYSLMTEAERESISRVKIASIIYYIGTQGHEVGSYSVTEDVLTVNILAPTLESVSVLQTNLEKRDLVESVYTQTAQTEDNTDGNMTKQATVVIRLINKSDEEE